MATPKMIDGAFQRHPRPQNVPTKAVLMEQSLKKEKPATPTLSRIRQSPWKSLSHQGGLIQGGNTWSVCIGTDQLVMVKKIIRTAGEKELNGISNIMDHPNIATLKQAFETDDSWYFQYEYSRFTLEEVLNIHLRLKEMHIRIIASSIFSAIQHIASAGVVHRDVSVATIRFRGNGVPILSGFEDCVRVSAGVTPSLDLEQLGVAILECMNGAPGDHLRDLEAIRQSRECNRLFGLDDGERWSGFKLLVDFLDCMFNVTTPAQAKLQKPHRYVSKDLPPSSLVPFLEIASLECFAPWRVAAAT